MNETETLRQVASKAFEYPNQAHDPKHEPIGYLDYRSYKPWLRDEYSFRCIYCLTREVWTPSGQDDFSVDHVSP